ASDVTPANPQLELSRAVAGEPAGTAGWCQPALLEGEAADGGADLVRYLHSLRRRWLVALIVALPLSALATYAAWSLIPREYTATAVLRVAPSDATLVFETADVNKAPSNTAFETYKR